MTSDMSQMYQDVETCSSSEPVAATAADLRCIQRARLADVKVVRRLGEGAYAYVDLVELKVKSPCGTPGVTVPRLVAGKLLRPADGSGDNDDADGDGDKSAAPAAAAACVLARWEEAAAAERGGAAIKPSDALAFLKQQRAHAACSASPFVVRLLASKTGRAGHRLMLLEYAKHGSLADVLRMHTARGGSDSGSDGGSTQQQRQGRKRRECECGPIDGGRPPPRGMPEHAARFYGACVLEALAHMHGQRFLHRDVKPANVLVFDDGYAKVADLGAACRPAADGEAPTTRTGTDGYWAPEVAAAAPQCGKADMYSLGVTLWELVGGAAPAAAAAASAAAEADAAAAHDPAAGAPAHFSPELRALLSALLARNPKDRPCAVSAREYAWFEGVDFEALRARKLRAPALPAACAVCSGGDDGEERPAAAVVEE